MLPQLFHKEDRENDQEVAEDGDEDDEANGEGDQQGRHLHSLHPTNKDYTQTNKQTSLSSGELFPLETSQNRCCNMYVNCYSIVEDD